MDLIKPIPLTELAEAIGAEIKGNADQMVRGFNEIHKVRPGDVMFVDHPKYYQKALDSAATVILIDKNVDVPPGKAILVVDHPFDVYDNWTRQYRPHHELQSTVSKDANIGANTVIEHGCVIAPNVTIGSDCYIEAGVYIGPHTVIGDRVHIGPNSVIASDAFYYKKKGSAYTKWHTSGRVVLEDDVDIGANCTINRGVSGDTVIGRGSKLDCLIHIGHGAVIGEDCLLAAQVGVSGKTIIGNRCTIYGQVGIAQSLHIGDDVVILAKSGVSKNLAAGGVYFGTPAEPAREKYRELAALRQLPEFMKKR